MNIEEKQKKCERNAVEFLKEHFKDDEDFSDRIYLMLRLSKDYKADNPELYPKDLKAFKLLFNSGYEDFKIALWNDLCGCKCEYDSADFTAEEYEFLQKTAQNECKFIFEENVNSIVKTDRLILRAVTDKDFKLFKYHYKNDGDFVMYCGLQPKKANVKLYAERRSPLYFVIEENQLHHPVGYVALEYKKDIKVGVLEYYIFKQYRNVGYCKEAVKILSKLAFGNKLVMPVSTVYRHIYKKRKIEVQTIRVRINEFNILSQKTVEGCGFVREAMLHGNMYSYGKGAVNEFVYYMTKDMYESGKHIAR